MPYAVQPAIDFQLDALADFFTRSFEGYFMPVNMTVAGLAAMLRRDSIDLALCRVLLNADRPAGLAFIARRGWNSRVAAMGILADNRGQGAGAYLMGQVLGEARERGERTLELEVIDQNAAAIRLYEKMGFSKMRHLVGFKLTAAPAAGLAQAANLVELDIQHVARRAGAVGAADYPWQLSAETLATFGPPARAYQLDGAYAVITNPALETVSIWAVLVEPEFRAQKQAERLIRAVLAAWPGKTWHVPAIMPEELGGLYENLGFVREPLGQFQMRLSLAQD